MGQKKDKERHVKFEGRLYRARPDRGPLNKDFTLADLKELAPKLQGNPVWYNHGDTEEIKNTRVGKIRRAAVDSEQHLFVWGRLRKPESLGPALHERIKKELVSGELPMLSMHWAAPAVNETAKPEDRVAIADKRWMKEISLVSKGLYPEANIVAVAASDAAHTAWKVVSGLLTSGPPKTSTVANTRSMASPAEKHAALLKHVDKALTEEEKTRFNTDAMFREDLYANLFPELLNLNQKFAQKEKRERDEYVSREVEDTTKVIESFKPHWKDAAESEVLVNLMTTSSKDFDNKATWGPLKKVFSTVAAQAAKIVALEKIAGAAASTTEPSTPGTPDTKSEAVSVAASDARNAKKPTPKEAYQAGLLARLAATNR
jgi:hypothetical protein